MLYCTIKVLNRFFFFYCALIFFTWKLYSTYCIASRKRQFEFLSKSDISRRSHLKEFMPTLVENYCCNHRRMFILRYKKKKCLMALNSDVLKTQFKVLSWPVKDSWDARTYEIERQPAICWWDERTLKDINKHVFISHPASRCVTSVPYVNKQASDTFADQKKHILYRSSPCWLFL